MKGKIFIIIGLLMMLVVLISPIIHAEGDMPPQVYPQYDWFKNELVPVLVGVGGGIGTSLITLAPLVASTKKVNKEMIVSTKDIQEIKKVDKRVSDLKGTIENQATEIVSLKEEVKTYGTKLDRIEKVLTTVYLEDKEMIKNGTAHRLNNILKGSELDEQEGTKEETV